MFIGKAMSPARVAAVQLAHGRKIALIVVPDHQLSLAIGREGQNARLAAKLTGWRIDIRSESQIAEMTEEELEAIIPLEEEYAEPTEEVPYGEEPVAEAALPGEVPPRIGPAETEFEPAPLEESAKPVEEEEERTKESVKRKARKGRTKQREIELELETIEDTGLGFFSDVLGDRQGKAGAGMEAAQLPGREAAEPVPGDSTVLAALAKATKHGDESLSPLAQALLKVEPVKKTAGKSKPTAKTAKPVQKAKIKGAKGAATGPKSPVKPRKKAAKGKGDADA